MKKAIGIGLIGFSLLAGCASRQRTPAENQAFTEAWAAVVFTKVEPKGCYHVRAESTEGRDYDGALENLRNTAAYLSANVVLIDAVENVHEMGIRSIRVTARLLDCPKK